MPSRSRNRVGPAVVMVVFLAALVMLAPLLAKYRNSPKVLVSKLQKMSAPEPKKPVVDMKHLVWVNRRSGLYYCHNSRFYGRMHPGFTMRQESALLKGFRPGDGQMCP